MKNILFDVLKSQLNIQNCEINKKLLEQDNLAVIYHFSKFHDIANIVADYLQKNGVYSNVFDKQTQEILANFKKQQMIAVLRYERIKNVYKRVCDCLEKAKIPFIPLKGALIRELYPKPEMRTSCDIDILVREKDVEKTLNALSSFAKPTAKQQNYDIHLQTEGGEQIELHYRLIAEAKQKNSFVNYVWSTARKKDGYEYFFEMTAECFIAYFIFHMAKHFKSGGCGIRILMDLWLICENISFDEKLLFNVFSKYKFAYKYNLTEFYKKSKLLSYVWFGGEKHTFLTQQMEEYIFRGGVYGTMEQLIAVQQMQKKSKASYIFSRLFISYKELAIYYPVLKKCAVLYPFFIVVRWFKLFTKKSRNIAKVKLKINQNLTEEQKEKLVFMYDQLGL